MSLDKLWSVRAGTYMHKKPALVSHAVARTSVKYVFLAKPIHGRTRIEHTDRELASFGLYRAPIDAINAFRARIYHNERTLEKELVNLDKWRAWLKRPAVQLLHESEEA